MNFRRVCVILLCITLSSHLSKPVNCISNGIEKSVNNNNGTSPEKNTGRITSNRREINTNILNDAHGEANVPGNLYILQLQNLLPPNQIGSPGLPHLDISPPKVHDPVPFKSRPIFNGFKHTNQFLTHSASYNVPRPFPVYGSPPVANLKPQYIPFRKPNFNLKVPKPNFHVPLHYKFVSPSPSFSALKPLHLKVNNDYKTPLPVYGVPHTFPLVNLPVQNPYPVIKNVPDFFAPNLVSLPGDISNLKTSVPPTPPDIKYDGWQPISGSTAHYLSSYGVPKEGSNYNKDVDISLLVPPQEPPPNGPNLANFNNQYNAPKTSYGVPLNSITSFEGVDNPHNHQQIHQVDITTSNLINIPEINLNDKNPLPEIIDSYSVPPENSYSPNGPYPSSVAPLENFPQAVSNIHNFKQTSSVVVNQPKSPVTFREPVPAGLIQSIGDTVAYKDALGIPHNQLDLNTQTYIPPPVPDLVKQNQQLSIVFPTNLYALPNANSPLPFQTSLNDNLRHNNIDCNTDIKYTDTTNLVPPYEVPNLQASHDYVQENNKPILLNTYQANEEKPISDDFLLSILSAIEQPKNIQQFNQHYEDLQYAPSNSIYLQKLNISETQNINQSLQPEQNSYENHPQKETNKDYYNVIDDNNNVAIYFNTPNNQNTLTNKQDIDSAENQPVRSTENQIKFEENKN